jgi:hypothetical protein
MDQADKTIPDAPQFERRILHDYFVRFHMSVILAAVISSGVLSSRLLMAFGVPLHLRYPIAVLASYCVFLVLVRVWIWYVSVRTAAGLQIANRIANLNFGCGGSRGSLDIGGGFSGGSGSGGGFSGFGGGASGGGGASSSWEGNDAAAIVSQPSSVSSGSAGGHSWPDLDFGDGDDDSWMVIALLIALVAGILGGGIYLVYAAPHILPEAAGQVLLAGTLKQASRQQHHTWVDGLVWSTWIPFVLVLIIAGALGWEAHRHCPVALRLLEVLNCPAQ